MPNSLKSFLYTVTCFVAIILLCNACNQFKRDVPFPTNETGYNDPVTMPLTFGAPVAIQWSSVSADSTSPMEATRFDFNSLPSKPFIIGEPLPLPKPVTEQKFDWNSIPDTAFNIETLPTQKLKFRTTRLGAPVISKAGSAAPAAGASRGVMEASISFGLPGFARSFLHDKKHGQLWIGTNKGLCKYDGTNIYVYATEQGLKDADITSILEDSVGNIWASTNSGELFVFDFKAGLIKQLMDSFLGNSSWALIQDNVGQIWFTRQNVGVFIINTQKETIKKISKNEGLIDNSCIRVFQDREGIVWITSGNGFNAIDPKSGKLKRIQKQHGININFAVMVMQDKADRIWLAGNGGVNIIDKKKSTVKLLSVDQGLQEAVFAGTMEDQTGKVWMGSTTGQVFVYDEKAGTMEKIKLTEEGNNTVVHYIYEGLNGQIWLGTTNTSSYYINTLHGRPGNFTKADGLGNNLVWSIKEDNNGYYWIGTRGGIDVYDPATKTIKHFGAEKGIVHAVNTCLALDPTGRIWAGGNNVNISIIDIKKGTIHYLGRQQGLVGSGWNSLSCDKQGQMWITSNEGDVQVVDPVTFSIKRITNIPELNARMDILKEDRQGNMWIGITGGGVSVVDKERKTIKNINTAKNMSSNDITSMLQDAKGNMWIGTQRGLNVANLIDSTLTTFATNEGLANNEIWSIDEIGGNIYIGNTLGFSILSPTNKDSILSKSWKARSFGKPQGLTYTDVAENSSFVTNKGQIWAGVDNQILLIMDPPADDTIVPKPHVTHFSIFDHPQMFSDKIALEEALQKIDTLWKAEKDSFYANKKLPADTSYQLKNGIEWDGTEGPYAMPVNLHLPYHQNFVSFSFASNQTTNPDRVKYRYILEGIDKKWSPISSETVSENYRDLPPGDYTFKVACMGMNGIWSEPAAFSFTITPPWWKSWWAYLLYIIIIGGLLYAIAQYRSRWLQKENRILEEKISHRTEQLKKTIDELQNTQSQLVQSEKMASLGELTAGIAHEIQNPLNFVNNFSEVNSELISELVEEVEKGNTDEVKLIAADIKANSEKIIHHGKRADAIVKGMLLHSRSSSGVKESTNINALADEYLRLAYHGLRAKDKSFNAGMQTDFDEHIGLIQVIPQDMGRVILNLITNAFYVVAEKKKLQSTGYEPMVKVTTKKADGKVMISVQDNGNGIPQKVLDKIFQPFFTTKPAGEGTGLGLSMSYEIVTKGHGGELLVETKEGEGTTFTIQLPI